MSNVPKFTLCKYVMSWTKNCMFIRNRVVMLFGVIYGTCYSNI
jgi:hypothetical protein